MCVCVCVCVCVCLRVRVFAHTSSDVRVYVCYFLWRVSNLGWYVSLVEMASKDSGECGCLLVVGVQF